LRLPLEEEERPREVGEETPIPIDKHVETIDRSTDIQIEYVALRGRRGLGFRV